jgi:hypothetical protein
VTLADPALAWNKPTHQIIAAIAYDVLKQDSPETIARVVELLKHHPQYDTFATRLQTVPAEDRDRFLLMQAARWPDDVRDNKMYHHGPWHYVNFPVYVSGDEGKVKAPTPPTPNILTALAAERDDGLAGGVTTIRGIPIREAWHVRTSMSR